MTALSIHPDEETAAQAAAELLARSIGEAQAERSTAHVSLAGGNTPRRAYELLGPLLGAPERIEWWFGDERCVPADDPDSNFRMVAESLLLGPAGAGRVHRIAGELAPEAAAESYEEELRRFVPEDDDGIPQLDLA